MPRRAHQRPAGSLEVCHDVAAAPLAVASLRRRPLIDSATIYIPAIEDHVVLALADKFHVVIVPGFVRDTMNSKPAIVVSLGFLQIREQAPERVSSLLAGR
jgi:hypothetical protein